MKIFLQRLKQVADTNFNGVTNLAKLIGVKPDLLRSYFTKDSIPGPNLRDKFSQIGINNVWLDYGQGEMLLNTANVVKEPVVSYNEQENEPDFENDSNISHPQGRLREFLKAMNLKPAELARKLNMSPQHFNFYLKQQDGAIFKEYQKFEILKELGLNLEWYIDGTGDMLTKENSIMNIIPTKMRKPYFIKYVTIPLNAGLTYNFSDIKEAIIEVYEEFAATVKAFTVVGNSMSPTIPSGTMIFIDEAIEPQHDEICGCVVDGISCCKRFKIIDNKRYLYSDNLDYKPIEINGFNNAKFLGKVIKYEVNL